MKIHRERGKGRGRALKCLQLRQEPGMHPELFLSV